MLALEASRLFHLCGWFLRPPEVVDSLFVIRYPVFDGHMVYRLFTLCNVALFAIDTVFAEDTCNPIPIGH